MFSCKQAENTEATACTKSLRCIAYWIYLFKFILCSIAVARCMLPIRLLSFLTTWDSSLFCILWLKSLKTICIFSQLRLKRWSSHDRCEFTKLATLQSLCVELDNQLDGLQSQNYIGMWKTALASSTISVNKFTKLSIIASREPCSSLRS